MEKDGWLDQFLLGMLNVLSQTWLAVAVALIGGFLVAYLARISPKKEWDFIAEWPGRVLFGAFLVLASVRSVPRLVFPTYQFECEQVPGPLGIPVQGDCELVPDRPIRTVVDYTMGDFFRDFALSLVQDLILGGIGAGLGIVVATMVRRRRRPAAPPR